MLTEICEVLHNYFLNDSDPYRDIHPGTYVISGGTIAPLDFLVDGQYFRIAGSRLNDGVYQYPSDILRDETFAGEIWAMNIPPSVIALADEIKAYQQSDAARPSAYMSESFGGYSYTRATDRRGAAVTWQRIFSKQMDAYRRVRAI